jgi:hypothetical protein
VRHPTSYIDHVEQWGYRRILHSWTEHTERNLLWHYGPERAAQIIAGNDLKSLTDLRAWRNFGSAKAA